MTCSIPDNGNATVTFKGLSAKAVTLTLTANADTSEEDGLKETVDIGLGALDKDSGTGLDGGAVGIDSDPWWKNMRFDAGRHGRETGPPVPLEGHSG